MTDRRIFSERPRVANRNFIERRKKQSVGGWCLSLVSLRSSLLAVCLIRNNLGLLLLLLVWRAREFLPRILLCVNRFQAQTRSCSFYLSVVVPPIRSVVEEDEAVATTNIDKKDNIAHAYFMSECAKNFVSHSYYFGVYQCQEYLTMECVSMISILMGCPFSAVVRSPGGVWWSGLGGFSTAK